MKRIVVVVLAAAAAVLSGCAAEIVPPAPGESTETLRQSCGGIAAFPCPEGYTCVDDRRDSCDPDRGGADCPGVCKRAPRQRCDYGAAGYTYVGRSPEECSTIRFLCAEGTEYFANDCGCGCRDTGSACTSIALCVEGYTWDDTTCECVPVAAERCGDTTCGAGEYCCNASCGICAPEGGGCIQIFCG